MIQLSDTKAASALGALLGQKPKAGGDASAFALALGDLATEGTSTFSIPLPRQAIAADGSPLPDEPIDADTDKELNIDIGLMLAGMPVTADVRADASDTRIAPDPARVEASPEADSADTVRIADINALDPAPMSERPVAQAPVPASIPGVDSRQPAARSVAEVPLTVPHALDATAPPATDPTLRNVTPVAASPASGARQGAIAAPSATISIVAPNPKAVAPNVSASEAAPPTAVTRHTQSVSARLRAEPANAAPVRGGGSNGKTPPDPVASATVPTQPAKVEPSPVTPAKFAPFDHAPGVPSDRAAPRRIAVAPAIVAAPSLSTASITVADLIPAEHRPRMSISMAPTAPVIDPASLGLPAPVEAASRIADPAPLDTQATDWIEGMIEQIDVMRDAHAENASETTTTRIRLSPDALGGVEIVLVGEGEAIDVRITADTATARTMLAEAAPRLTDMAEARGLKLAQGDAGQPGQHQAQRQQQPDQPTANRRRAADPERAASDLHERIA